jgi:hypothetical protein
VERPMAVSCRSWKNVEICGVGRSERASQPCFYCIVVRGFHCRRLDILQTRSARDSIDEPATMGFQYSDWASE